MKYIFWIFLSSPAFADIYFEPNFGLGMGSANVSSTTVNQSESFTAPALGARTGVFYDYVFVGLDLKVSYLALQNDTASSMYTGGLGVGFNSDYFPLRVFFSLDLLNNAKIQNSNLSAFGFRGGVGYFITESIVFNFEYQTVKFSGTNQTGGALTSNLNMFSANISFPLTFKSPDTPWRERYRTPTSKAAPAAPAVDPSDLE